jgi:SAM-dependent methyltransferase
LDGAGIVYVAIGDSLLEEAVASARSARAHHRHTPVCLITDDDRGAGGFDHTIVIEPLELDAPERQWAVYNKIHFLSQSPFERTLYLDTDTRCCAPLWEVFSALNHADLACAHAPIRRVYHEPRSWFQPEMNTGMLGYKRNLQPFFAAWLELFLNQYRAGERQRFGDQSVFARLLSETDVKLCVVPAEFNYRVSLPSDLVGPVKLLHGRPHEKLARLEQLLNRTLLPRFHLPGTGLVWIEGGNLRLLTGNSDEPLAIPRHELLRRAQGLPPVEAPLGEDADESDPAATRQATTPEHPHALKLKTSLPHEELRARLKEWEPWAHRIDFSNGVSTAEFERRTPFVENTLQKLEFAANAIRLETIETALDVGCNAGYNAIHLATEHGVRATGIDVVPRHIEVSRFLAEIAGVEAEFLLASAEEFLRPRTYDLILHFGTLYHLPNPARALEVAYANLRPGGWLALETHVYDDPAAPKLSYFLRGANNDPTNYWALSTPTLLELLGVSGFAGVEEQVRVEARTGGEHMCRMLVVARRPPVHAAEPVAVAERS